MVMMQNQHRARVRLDLISHLYKWLFDALPKLRDTERYWPDYVYVPSAVMEERIFKITNPDDFMPLRKHVADDFYEFVNAINTGLIWATWRLTQGVYWFDETLYPHLISTQGAEKIPVDILCRLPEWCIYLETPGMTMPKIDGTSLPMYGAWVSIDIKSQGMMALAITPDLDHLYLDYENGVITPEQRLFFILPTQHMSLATGGTVEDGLAESFDHLQPDLDPRIKQARDEIIRENAEWVKPIVNLLLYLCAGADYAGPAPKNPQPKKTKHGLRLFPPNKPTVWDVGVRMGSALRTAYTAQSASDGGAGVGRQVRPHIRRAHWHGFRSGARLTPEGQPIPAEKRRFDLRWLPPIAVNIEDIDRSNLPSVIHPVK
jgi:hypothetical protein